jgi:hemolysin III
MGWMALIAAAPLAARLGTETIAWILAGGVIYTIGTLIYHYNRIRYAHVVWHMFVLAGSVCHYVAISRL